MNSNNDLNFICKKNKNAMFSCLNLARCLANAGSLINLDSKLILINYRHRSNSK
jgi:hypothetical protein